MSETRTKKYKQYRSQIKKEALINEKLKKKNKDIELARKKFAKIDDDFFQYNDEQIFSSIHFVLPQTSNTIKEISAFIDYLKIDSLIKEYEKMIRAGNSISDIIKENGSVNKKYFENDTGYIKIESFCQSIKNFQEDLGNYSFQMRESENSENNNIHTMLTKDDDQRGYFYIEKKPYEKPHEWKYSKHFFIGTIVLTFILFITLMILLFI